jgi:hypothetical protein
MSQHVVMNRKATTKWVFGWDQPLQSFYLQVHDMNLPEDDRIVAWLGADKSTIMYEVDDLFREAMKHGLAIDHTYKPVLYREKDEGT